MNSSSHAAATQAPFLRSILPFALFVLIGFLAVGLPLPILPGFVHTTLGFNSVMVGIVIGAQAFAALMTRAFVGRYVDQYGGKRSVLIGLALAASSGLFYLLASFLIATPTLSLLSLLLGRIALGFSDSFIITGGLTWGIGRVGHQQAGRMMAILGMAMFGAVTFGAPLGAALNHAAGFNTLAIAVLVLPLLAFVVATQLQGEPASHSTRLPFSDVLNCIWQPGLGLALAVSGFGVLATFVTLFFAERGWPNASLALTLFGVGYIGVRLFLAHLPDRLGGARVAVISLALEAAGLLLLGLASSATMALVGALLTGVGFSLIFPSFGVEAIRRVPAHSRGAALGAYAAFFDLAFAITGPLGGMIAAQFGFAATYFFAALLSLLGILVSLALLVPPRGQQQAA